MTGGDGRVIRHGIDVDGALVNSGTTSDSYVQTYFTAGELHAPGQSMDQVPLAAPYRQPYEGTWKAWWRLARDDLFYYHRQCHDQNRQL